ncbi:regulator of sigma E protease [Entomoplasma freundtii]|uniref:Inner membrane zinc metalloprotease n=1 Tax=Entomoplasma freundtii TaxID=74700 RepID=A0A2K8NRR4_9MOLU|nr:site-2 protease family protein [Entomoplasma freundtii]ATZ16499.1 inner membrane zinc metalloprotease [Entomoplasma freundtii]TDY56028.1 regulator of sigma E protease [Entomoplasma freundtii]
MTIVFTLLLSLGSLLFIVTLHELGHFCVAKWSGAYVYEFALGFGPRLLTFKGKETWFSIRLLPLGGFVSIAMEAVDPPKGREEEIVPENRKMEALPTWKRSLFILAGPLVNLGTAILIVTTVFMATLAKPNDMGFYGQRLASTGIAYKLIKEQEGQEDIDDQGYILLGYEVYDTKGELRDKAEFGTAEQLPIYSNIVYKFIDNFQKDIYQEQKDLRIKFNYLNFDYQNHKVKSSQVSSGKWTQLSKPDDWQIQGKNTTVGIMAPTRYFLTRQEAYRAGWRQVGQDSLGLLKAFGQIFKGNIHALSGPVGLVKGSSQTTNVTTPASFLLGMGAISANLFMFNFLPFPPLDGYKFCEAWWEKARKKEINSKVKIGITAVGVSFMLLLFIIVTIKDLIGG